MTRRHDARRRAFDILYQADASDRDPAEVLEERSALGEGMNTFTRELVLGVAERMSELDALIGAHAEGWTVTRLASVDRTLLRVACYEILHRDDIPTAVAIDEAVDAAKELSTERSGGFVNGILGKIARDHAGTA
ncbi:MAG TPA: transcription antitermination factor NusB [Actinomycetota bacterium]